MPRLKDHFHSIPNGFQYRQVQTGWELTAWDFMSLCRELQKHRQANPQFKLNTNMGAIIEEVDRVNAFRMLTIQGAEIYITETGGPTAGNLKARQRPLSAVAVDAVQKVKLINSGRSLLSEWKSDGYVTVDQDESNRRAKICSDCPQNGDGDFTKYFTVPYINKIKAEIEELKGHKLATDYDDQLRICMACTCVLRVKVQVPIGVILKHTSKDTMEKLDKRCWILPENEATHPSESDLRGLH